MAIITISRGSFAGGERLATLLGERLGYRVVSREQLYERARAEFGVSMDAFVELMERAPTLFPRGARESRRLLTALQATLCELVRDDNAVYHGHSGHLFLPGIAHVLRVRLIAPRSKRMEMARRREGLTEHEASSKIDQVDAERARWTLFFYGVQWGDPGLYDVTLNLERMAPEDAADLVAAMTRLPLFRPTEGSLRQLRDVALASLVKTRLLFDPVMSVADVEVEAEGGKVRLIGLGEGRLASWATEQVRQIPGVVAVEVSPGTMATFQVP
jgi:cytidylate kinase